MLLNRMSKRERGRAGEWINEHVSRIEIYIFDYTSLGVSLWFLQGGEIFFLS